MELQPCGVPVADVTMGSAGELRLLNPNHQPEDTEGRVDAKLRLRRLSANGDAHLYAKSDRFVGRGNL